MTTLLKVVQDVLSSIDGDEVNSISETVESDSVTNIVESCFLDIVNTSDRREIKKPFTLTAIGSTKPTLMERPSDIVSVDWIRYDIKDIDDDYPNMRDMAYLSIEEFLSHIYGLPRDLDSSVYGSFSLTVDGSNITFYYRKDKQPEYYTTVDDTYIVFDSYDSDVESSLQESKSLCFGKVSLTFSKADSWVIPLDSIGVKHLTESAKARASVELRQTENMKAEKSERRYHIRSQFEGRQIGPPDGYAQIKGYGRRTR